VIANFFVKLGKALLLPLAALPIIAIFMRLGQPDILNIPPMAMAGTAVFNNLACIFAISIAIGFSDDKNAVVGLAAFIGHIVFMGALQAVSQSADMGVFSGIIVGLTTGILYNKFNNISFPSWLSFFGGKRFIPIITALVTFILGCIFAIFWGSVERLTAECAKWLFEMGNVGLFGFGFLNRLLIPFGLNKTLNSIEWFQAGYFTDALSMIVHGDMLRFFAGDPSAGAFMSGMFPVTMFGLLGCALAIIYTAEPPKRKTVGGFIAALVLVSFMAGITEPLEFAFMFFALPLYFVHCLLMGASMVVANALDIKVGFHFGAGLIDYIASFPVSTNPIRLIPIGAASFFIYFFLFSFAIRYWNFKTSGREDDDVIDVTEKPKPITIGQKIIEYGDPLYTAACFILAVGGKDNIVAVGNCNTRVRIRLVDGSRLDETQIKKIGARGVINTKGLAQIIVGSGSEAAEITSKIKEVLQ
jgi:PTS system N-acetylglucosamine-specific IIC component